MTTTGNVSEVIAYFSTIVFITLDYYISPCLLGIFIRILFDELLSFSGVVL